MADTKIKGKVRTMICAIDDTTVIEEGDLVALSSGKIIKATATSEKVARAQEAHASGDGTKIEVTRGEIDLIMDAEDAFAVSQRGGEYDLAVDGSSGKQTIDQSNNTYKVLMVDSSQDAGTVGSTDNVKVKINKPIDERA